MRKNSANWFVGLLLLLVAFGWRVQKAAANYIYAQGASKDLRLLIVSVEPDEAVVMQLKIDADKLSEFINQETKGH